jgi:hypothetical protein
VALLAAAVASSHDQLVFTSLCASISIRCHDTAIPQLLTVPRTPVAQLQPALQVHPREG